MAATTSRSAEKTVGRRLRSSSACTPAGSGISTSTSPPLGARAAWAGPGLAHPQQGGPQHREQDLAPGVERPGADPAAAGDEFGAG